MRAPLPAAPPKSTRKCKTDVKDINKRKAFQNIFNVDQKFTKSSDFFFLILKLKPLIMTCFNRVCQLCRFHVEKKRTKVSEKGLWGGGERQENTNFGVFFAFFLLFFWRIFWTICYPVRIFDLSTLCESVVPGVLTTGVKGSNRVLKKKSL